MGILVINFLHNSQKHLTMKRNKLICNVNVKKNLFFCFLKEKEATKGTKKQHTGRKYGYTLTWGLFSKPNFLKQTPVYRD